MCDGRNRPPSPLPPWCCASQQVFNPDYTITNGVYLGSFPVLKFTGTFTWEEEKARLEFTFDQVLLTFTVWVCARWNTPERKLPTPISQIQLWFLSSQGKARVCTETTRHYCCDTEICSRSTKNHHALLYYPDLLLKYVNVQQETRTRTTCGWLGVLVFSPRLVFQVRTLFWPLFIPLHLPPPVNRGWKQATRGRSITCCPQKLS